MPHHANQTSFKQGINPRTGGPAMTHEQRKLQRKVYYQRHKATSIHRNWIRQIIAIGCTPEMYSELFKMQNGVCAICGGTNGKKKLAVDHDHTTDQVRGLLCNLCNAGLGAFGDDANQLRKAIDYLCASPS